MCLITQRINFDRLKAQAAGVVLGSISIVPLSSNRLTQEDAKRKSSSPLLGNPLGPHIERSPTQSVLRLPWTSYNQSKYLYLQNTPPHDYIHTPTRPIQAMPSLRISSGRRKTTQYNDSLMYQNLIFLLFLLSETSSYVE